MVARRNQRGESLDWERERERERGRECTNMIGQDVYVWMNHGNVCQGVCEPAGTQSSKARKIHKNSKRTASFHYSREGATQVVLFSYETGWVNWYCQVGGPPCRESCLVQLSSQAVVGQIGLHFFCCVVDESVCTLAKSKQTNVTMRGHPVVWLDQSASY